MTRKEFEHVNEIMSKLDTALFDAENGARSLRMFEEMKEARRIVRDWADGLEVKWTEEAREE